MPLELYRLDLKKWRLWEYAEAGNGIQVMDAGDTGNALCIAMYGQLELLICNFYQALTANTRQSHFQNPSSC